MSDKHWGSGGGVYWGSPNSKLTDNLSKLVGNPRQQSQSTSDTAQARKSIVAGKGYSVRNTGKHTYKDVYDANGNYAYTIEAGAGGGISSPVTESSRKVSTVRTYDATGAFYVDVTRIDEWNAEDSSGSAVSFVFNNSNPTIVT